MCVDTDVCLPLKRLTALRGCAFRYELEDHNDSEGELMAPQDLLRAKITEREGKPIRTDSVIRTEEVRVRKRRGSMLVRATSAQKNEKYASAAKESPRETVKALHKAGYFSPLLSLLSAKTSSGSEVYRVGDDVILAFSEPVTCTDKFLDGKTRDAFSAQLKFGDAKDAVELDTSSPQLKYACTGSTITLSVAADASGLVGQTIKVTVKGVYDHAGNVVAASTSSDVLVVNTDADLVDSAAELLARTQNTSLLISTLSSSFECYSLFRCVRCRNRFATCVIARAQTRLVVFLGLLRLTLRRCGSRRLWWGHERHD